jgi:hypothetical protein
VGLGAFIHKNSLSLSNGFVKNNNNNNNKAEAKLFELYKLGSKKELCMPATAALQIFLHHSIRSKNSKVILPAAKLPPGS